MSLDRQKAMTAMGQIESTVSLMEEHLSEEDFQAYCDDAYSCIAQIRASMKTKKDETSDN